MNNKITDKRAIRLLLSNNFEKAGKMIFQIFLNIYIWKNTHDVKTIALFNIYFLTAHSGTYILIGFLVKKGFHRILNSISLLGVSLAFLLLILLGELAIDYIYYVAVIFGFFNGMYWLNYHVMQFKLTSFNNRGNYTGLKKSSEGLFKIAVPSLVGFLISLNYLGYGYSMAFGIGILFFIIALFLGNINLFNTGSSSFEFVKLFKQTLKNKNVFSSLYAYTFTGFSFGNTLLEVVIGIIIFQYVGQEAHLGYALSIISAVSIIVMYVIGKFLPYTQYKYALWLFGGAYIIALVGFVSIDNLLIIIIFSSLIGIFAGLYSLPQKVISDNVLHQIKNYKEYRTEYMILREMFLYIGWIITFILLYFLDGVNVESIRPIFLLMALLVFISTYKLAQINLKEK